MNKKYYLPLFAATLFATGTFAAPELPPGDPYGVCTHVDAWEFKLAPQMFTQMKELSLKQVRTDFTWRAVNPKPGEWNFSRHDAVVDLAEKKGISLLPILTYDVAWASPAHRHLDAWGEYVRKTVSRYQRKLRAWEIFNEPNIGGFWNDTPSGKDYAKLLKRSYEEIKKIDPELTVVYGGVNGVPLPYIEESFQAGAGKWFDVMAVHPYSSKPEDMLETIAALKALMKKYGIDKPIYATEIGWSTMELQKSFAPLLSEALKQVGIVPAETPLVITDVSTGTLARAEWQLPRFKERITIGLDELKNLDPARYPVLIPCIGERFEMKYFPDLVQYVRKGGTLLLMFGLPFYYDLQPDGKGGLREVKIENSAWPELHIGWEAFWTNKDVPFKEKTQKAAPGFTQCGEISFMPMGRFLHDRNLKPGDQFIPIIEATADRYHSAAAALYKLNSDLKGNVIVCPTMKFNRGVSEEKLSELVSRTFLNAKEAGIDKLFFYQYRAIEENRHEPEDHFGIVHHDLQPKKAFYAWKLLSQLLPPQSKEFQLEQQTASLFHASWRRPDGKKIHAVWSAGEPVNARLSGSSAPESILRHWGPKVQPAADQRYRIDGGPLFFCDVETLSIVPDSGDIQ